MGSNETKLSGPDLRAGVPLTDLTPGKPLLGHADGAPVLMTRIGDEIFAVGASCTHYSGPLAEGLVMEDTVRCPWHHACFSLRTGEALRAPALNPVARYDVARRDGSLFVSGKRAASAGVRRRALRERAPASVGIVGAGAAGTLRRTSVTSDL